MKLSQLKLSEAIIMMVYAEPKIGKSHFAATAAETDRIVIITDLNGIETYAGAAIRKQFPKLDENNIEVEIITRDGSLSQAKAFQQINDVLREYFEQKLDKFDTIVIDDSSFVKNQARNLAIKINGTSGRSSTYDKALKDNKPSFNNISVLEESDFGREMEMVANFFEELTSMCRKHGKNLIVCAHEAQIYIKKKNDKGKDVPTLDRRTAAFTGKKEPTATSRYFSIVARLTAKGKEASRQIVFQCKADDIVDAGDRFGVLNTYEYNLTWRQLKEKVAAQVAAVEPVRIKKEESPTPSTQA
jgi:thymidine kinase